MSPRASRLAAWIPLGLVLLVALVFGRALSGGFVYDDYYLIETNPELRAPGPLTTFLGTGIFSSAGNAWAATGARYWRPFLKLAVLVQYRAFGLDPRGWHWVSLLVHAASVWLLWRWLRRRVGDGGLVAVTLGTALFAVHPSRVEAVAWISGSADLWMTFWVLAGLEAWDRAGRLGTWLASGAFLVAVFSKETAFLVPLCLAADAWWLGPRDRAASWGHRARWRIGLVTVVLGAALALQLAVVPGAARLAGGPVWLRPLSSLGHLVAHLVWPWRPSTQIGLVDATGQFELPVWSLALGGASLLALAWFVVAARRLARLRPAAADLAWCVVPLLPVLNLVPLGYTTLVAERFLSLPLLGVASLAVRGLAGARVRWPRAAARVAIAGAVWLAAGALMAAAFVPAFRSNATLWAHELRLQPHNPLLHLYAARAAAQEGRLGDALRAARTSYEVAASPDGRTDAAVTWAQLRLQASPRGEAAVDGELRALFDALAEGRAPVRLQAGGFIWELAPTPEHRTSVVRAPAFRGARAMVYARTGNYATAAGLFFDLLRDDSSAATYASLVRMQASAGDWQRAGAALHEGLRVHPGEPQLAGLRGPLDRAVALTAAPPADAEERAATWGQLWLELGVALRARQEFEALGHPPQQPIAVLVEALTDAALGNPTAARQRVEALRRTAPEHSPDCDAVLAEIDRLSAGASSAPRRINPGQMFE